MKRRTDLEFIHDLLVKIDDKQDDMAVVQAEQKIILDEHIRRSEANEAAIEELKVHNARIQGGVGLLSLIALIASIWAAFKS